MRAFSAAFLELLADVREDFQLTAAPEPGCRLTKELLDEKGMSLDQAMAIVRRALTVESILISYNIDTDIEWLGLKVDTDFGVSTFPRSLSGFLTALCLVLKTKAGQSLLAGQLDTLTLSCQGMIDLKGLYRIDPETGKFDRTLVSLPPPQVQAASCQELESHCLVLGLQSGKVMGCLFLIGWCCCSRCLARTTLRARCCSGTRLAKATTLPRTPSSP